VEEVKKGSSKWIKTKSAALPSFHWEDGYAAFSRQPVEGLGGGRLHRQRKNTTARGRSRKSSFSFCANTVWNTMSVISGPDLACDPFRVVMRSRVGPHFPGVLPPATLSAPFQGAQRLRPEMPEMEGTCLLTLNRNPGRAISALALQGETKGRPKGRPCIFHGGQRSQFVPVNVRSFETF
jgi:hypothetical protein